MFYSPEPLLTQDATAIQEQPGLRDAYSYGLSNPVGYIDPTGYRPLRPGYSQEQDAAIAKMRKDWAAGHGPDDVLAGRTGRPASSDEAGRLRRRCASIGR
jgi:hypothetical protein